MNDDLKERLECSGYAVKEDGDVDDSLLSEALARIEQLEADLEKARKALEPFAEAHDNALKSVNQTGPLAIFNAVAAYFIEWPHLRAAATSLQEISR